MQLRVDARPVGDPHRNQAVLLHQAPPHRGAQLRIAHHITSPRMHHDAASRVSAWQSLAISFPSDDEDMRRHQLHCP